MLTDFSKSSAIEKSKDKKKMKAALQVGTDRKRNIAVDNNADLGPAVK